MAAGPVRSEPSSPEPCVGRSDTTEGSRRSCCFGSSKSRNNAKCRKDEMAKPRVHEVAKELGLTSKEVLAHLEKIGQPVKSHSSSLEEALADRVRSELRGAASAGPQKDEEVTSASRKAPAAESKAPPGKATAAPAGSIAPSTT